MSAPDVSGMDDFFGRADWFPSLTPDALARALAGFKLPFVLGKDFDWLSMAVRRALAGAHPFPADGPDRTPEKKVRDDLRQIGRQVGDVWQKLFTLEHAADFHLFQFAQRYWDGEGGIEIGNGLVIGDATDYRRLKAAIGELDWLAGFLGRAADAVDVPKGQWRTPEQKQVRIERARFLAPIFEAAFGNRVSANNYPSDARHKAPTPFMSFYEAIVDLAFGARETTNLAEVVKAACKLHSECPVRFAPGLIAGL